MVRNGNKQLFASSKIVMRRLGGAPMQKTLQHLQANRYTQLTSAWRVIEKRDDQHDVRVRNSFADHFLEWNVTEEKPKMVFRLTL